MCLRGTDDALGVAHGRFEQAQKQDNATFQEYSKRMLTNQDAMKEQMRQMECNQQQMLAMLEKVREHEAPFSPFLSI